MGPVIIGLFLCEFSDRKETCEKRHDENPRPLKIMLQVGIAHGRMVYKRNHQIPKPDICPQRKFPCENDTQQDESECKPHDSRSNRSQGVLYGPHEPWPANAIADVSEPPVLIFEHANFVDLGTSKYRKAQVRHFMNKRSRKRQKVHKEIGKIVIDFLEYRNLQSLKAEEQ